MPHAARIAAAFAALAALGAGRAAALDSARLTSPDPFDFRIVDQDLRSVLLEFGAAMGVPVSLDPDIAGRVTNMTARLSAADFLTRLTTDHSLVWYHDGQTIHVTEARDNRSLMIDFAAVPPDVLRAALSDLGLDDPRFPIRSVPGSTLGVLTGPPRLVEMVENAFAVLARQTNTGPVAQAPAPPRAHSVLIVRGDSLNVWNGLSETPAGAPPVADEDGSEPAETGSE